MVLPPVQVLVLIPALTLVILLQVLGPVLQPAGHSEASVATSYSVGQESTAAAVTVVTGSTLILQVRCCPADTSFRGI